MLTAIKFTFIMTVFTGVFYPLLMTGVARVAFTDKANGSLIKQDQKIIGSELIAQKFTNDKYFWSRPSAVDYNAMSSGGSNLGPTSEALTAVVKERALSVQESDMLFASGSGLDPHITPESATQQLLRVAKARQMSEEAVVKIVSMYTETRQFGILGENRVNVLKLNLALDKVK